MIVTHKIEKFGKIFENEDGDIILNGFSIDCGGDEFSPEKALRAVIKRLEDELMEGIDFEVNEKAKAL